jgi:hypothetical protein
LCGFVDWDNSPRKWRRAYIVDDATPEAFWSYMQELIQKSKNHNPDTPLIFLNAWNEWAEWAYLEPDVDNQTFYLDQLVRLKRR